MRKQVAYEKLRQLEQDLLVAEQARATFLTTLPASSDLAERAFGYRVRSNDDGLLTHLQLELPYFERTNFATIAAARREIAAFEEFRVAYSKGFRDIAKEQDPLSRHRQAGIVMREYIHAPLARIDQDLRDFSKNRVLACDVAAGSLIYSLLSHANPFAWNVLSAAAASGIVDALKAYRQEQFAGKMRGQPGFFYWKAARGAPQPISPALPRTPWRSPGRKDAAT